MIDRTAMVGTFPAAHVCIALFLACAIVALLLGVAIAVSWFRGDE